MSLIDFRDVINAALSKLLSGRPPLNLVVPIHISVPRSKRGGEEEPPSPEAIIRGAYRVAHEDMLVLLARYGMRPEHGVYDVTAAAWMEHLQEWVAMLTWTEGVPAVSSPPKDST